MNFSLNQTLLTWLRWFWHFSVRVYLPLIWKDSLAHLHSLSVYVKKGLPFAQNLSLENSADSYLSFCLALLHSVPHFCFLYWFGSSSLPTVFGVISSIIDEVLSISSSADVFVFGDFSVHHKDWLAYFGGMDRPVDLCYYFYITSELIWWLTFLLKSMTVTLTVLLFWIYIFLLMLMVFPPFGNSDHVFFSVSNEFPLSSIGDAPFHFIAYDFLYWLRQSSWSFEKWSMGGYL